MKFSFPHCGQHIAIAGEDLDAFWERKITCPACDERIVLRKPKASGKVPGVEPAPPKNPDRTGTVQLKAFPRPGEGNSVKRSGNDTSWHEDGARRSALPLQLPQFWIAAMALLFTVAIVLLYVLERRPAGPAVAIRFVDSSVAISCARDAIAASTDGQAEMSWISGTLLTNWNERCVVLAEVDCLREGGESEMVRYLCSVALNEDNTYSYDAETGIAEIEGESPRPDELQEFLSRNKWDDSE